MARGVAAVCALALIAACGDDGPPADTCAPMDTAIARVADDPRVDVAFALGDATVGVAVHAKGTDRLDVASYDVAGGAALGAHMVTAPDEIAACPDSSPTCRGGMRMAASPDGFAALWPALIFDNTGFPADPYANNLYLVGWGAFGEGVRFGPARVHEQDGTDLVDAVARAIEWDGADWLVAWSEIREAPAQMGRVHTFHMNTAGADGVAAYDPAVQIRRDAIVRPDAAIARDDDQLVVAWLEREGDPTHDDVWLYKYDLNTGAGRLDARTSDDLTRAWPSLVRVEGGFAYGWKRATSAHYEVMALDAAAARGDVTPIAVSEGSAYHVVAVDGGAKLAIATIAGGDVAVVVVEADGGGVPGRYAVPAVGDGGVVRDLVEIAGGVRVLYTRSDGVEHEVRVADVCR